MEQRLLEHHALERLGESKESDRDRSLAVLRTTTSWMSRTELHHATSNRWKADRLVAALADLEDSGLIETRKRQSEKGRTIFEYRGVQPPIE